MALNFDHDLDEIVRIGNRDVTLRTAIKEHREAQGALRGRLIAPPMWHREHGKVPPHFELDHMDELAKSIPIEDLNASNDE
jgi:hypothetical protein